jgi:hypothetical protein
MSDPLKTFVLLLMGAGYMIVALVLLIWVLS